VEVKRDILWRVYLSYIVVVAVCLFIFAKAFYIQKVEGAYWRSMSDSLHQKIEEIDAERGTIYSEDGEMLSTSIPQFDVYIDFGADGLREKSGKRFRENLDSLSYCLSNLFKDKTDEDYKKMLSEGYKDKNRYFLLRKKINFREYQQLVKFPLVRQGRNKSGFIAEVKRIRLNPYQMLAFRTIGLARDSFKVGLEMTYDTVLKGTKGSRLVRYIAGGVSVPVDNEDAQIDPENGKDIVTTLDVHIQDITENALMRTMVENEAEYGTAIVMEVKTGKIKAIANLGRKKDGTYWEDFNYAISPSEPGSTFKLATLISLFEDGKANINTLVNLEGGKWLINKRTVWDSEQHGLYNVNMKRAFEVSSNVGMAKMAYVNYSANPYQFINHLEKLHLKSTTGIDLAGERAPTVFTPKSKYWSAVTLPWMAFGYNLAITPMHTAMLYNAVANKGKMLQPYLVSAITDNGITIQQFKAKVLNEKICSDNTLSQLKQCLVGVTTVEHSTGYALFQGTPYTVAGKTGTALVANGRRGYADKIYQSSFAGFFPAENPQYTIVVVVKNKPHAAKYYGALVAGPVFKEIADRLYTMYVRKPVQQYTVKQNVDSTWFAYTGLHKDVKKVFSSLNVKSVDSAKSNNVITRVYKQNGVVVNTIKTNEKQLPILNGMTLKDAVFVCENMGLKVSVKGRGKVSGQSIIPGTIVKAGQPIEILLN
jgi:cell division protein FtsI (penicillin-binding protein 3)